MHWQTIVRWGRKYVSTRGGKRSFGKSERQHFCCSLAVSADVDVAQESANFARQQILVQSGTAMLAQANVLPQSALRLIG